MIKDLDINNQNLIYCINLEYERNQWNNFYLNKWIFLPDKCKGFSNTHLKINNNE